MAYIQVQSRKSIFFLGYIEKHKERYDTLATAGFILIFKKVLISKYGEVKGNCDADLVVACMENVYELEQGASVVLVTSDGDFAPLVKFLQRKGACVGVLSPSEPAKCSLLLKQTNAAIVYISDVKSRIKKE
jgi:uncharacterized LabA/DUF88 family protein